LKWAEFFGGTVAKFGGTLVTGVAKGVDMAATVAALREGGTAIGVLAEGISAPPRRLLRTFIENGQMLLLSQFEPTVPWTVGAAMTRNETICRLGNAMFVIEAGASGGTLAAGRTALRIGVPLYAIAYPSGGQGNDILIDEGAHPLRRTVDLISVLNDSQAACRLSSP
jgi:DNA processing protein